jgi:hypothetical protein
LFIRKGTVKIHANDLLGKLGMRDRRKLQRPQFSAAEFTTTRLLRARVINCVAIWFDDKNNPMEYCFAGRLSNGTRLNRLQW